MAEDLLSRLVIEEQIARLVYQKNRQSQIIRQLAGEDDFYFLLTHRKRVPLAALYVCSQKMLGAGHEEDDYRRKAGRRTPLADRPFYDEIRAVSASR
jgi:hypothetical protein